MLWKIRLTVYLHELILNEGFAEDCNKSFKLLCLHLLPLGSFSVALAFRVFQGSFTCTKSFPVKAGSVDCVEMSSRDRNWTQNSYLSVHKGSYRRLLC